ncbi:MAG: hypothetical protein ABIJ50_14030 [Pseudomonadota bacterium]
MLILSGIACSQAILRSQLKHTWLENQLGNKSEDDIVFFWQGPGWPSLEREFRGRVSEAEQLINDLESGFSPAQLVDQLPMLVGLADDTKAAIKQAVHEVYLERSGIEELKKPLNQALSVLKDALARFLSAWGQPQSPESEQELRQVWRALSRCGEEFRNLLDRLPRGIVLP